MQRQQGLPIHNFYVALLVSQDTAVSFKKELQDRAAAAELSSTLHPAERRQPRGRAPSALPGCRQPLQRMGLSAAAPMAPAGLHRHGHGGQR